MVESAGLVCMVSYDKRVTKSKHFRIVAQMIKENILDIALDKEEQLLLESVERGEWQTVPNFAEELAEAKKAAIQSLSKVENINLKEIESTNV